ncbi:MAG: TA system VapC family ribonuclease toxin [Terrimicrobiaceae bacterium]
MIVPDANLLLYAYDETSPFHAKARKWWERCLSGTEQVGLCPVVVFAFVRIGTHPRAYNDPMPIRTASVHVEGWLRRKVCHFLSMEEEDVSQAMKLLCTAGTGGDLTTDAQFAAIALRLDATVHTADTDFNRFAGVKIFNPLR